MCRGGTGAGGGWDTLKPNHQLAWCPASCVDRASGGSSVFRGAGIFSPGPRFPCLLPLGQELVRLKMEVSPSRPIWENVLCRWSPDPDPP